MGKFFPFVSLKFKNLDDLHSHAPPDGVVSSTFNIHAIQQLSDQSTHLVNTTNMYNFDASIIYYYPHYRSVEASAIW